jgi:hypothetical protein
LVFLLSQKIKMNRFENEGCAPIRRRLPGADFAALRCYGGGGGSADTSSASGEGSTTGAQSPQSIGSNSPVNTGSSQIVTQKGNVTFTTNTTTDPQAFSTIAEIVGNSLNNTAQTQQAIQAGNNANNDALNNILEHVVSADQSIAASASSGGITTLAANALKFGLIGLAAFVGWLLFRKKSS